MQPRKTVFLLLLLASGFSAHAQWPQFGGPNTDFRADSARLAETWPVSGPTQVWKRPLGEGYSAISVVDGVLYTMYRDGSQEVVLAASAADGETIWESKHKAPFRPDMSMENGAGPHATPLVTEHGVCVIGILARLRCLDRATGKLQWERDLPSEFGAPVPDRGFAASPVAYRDTLIVKAGGPDAGVIAFRQPDGALVWKSGDLGYSGSSPVIGNVDGFDQLVVFAADEIAALNPVNGDLQWRHRHSTRWGLNVSAPVWAAGNIVVCSSAYGAGSRAIEVRRVGDRVESSELWSTNQMRIHFTNAVRVGDYVYGSSGDFGPAPLTAIHAASGEIAWKDRAFSKANLIVAGDRLIVLDEDGTLALIRVSPQGLEVLAKTSLTPTRHWTVPTLAGTRLYVRNRREMLAFELGDQTPAPAE